MAGQLQSGHDQEKSVGRPPFRTRPLADTIGAEIVGLDLSHPLDPTTIEAVKKAWYDNGVLLFRGQEISEAAQIRFAEYFGPLVMRVPNGGDKPTPVLLISNIRENGKLIGEVPDGEILFHSDQTFHERPCSAGMLYAIEVTEQGGNTMFTSCYRAYEALPQSVRARLNGLMAMNIFDYYVTKAHTSFDEYQLKHVQPVVRIHPETGRKALYVNRLQTAFIEGMPAQESAELLDLLFNYQEQPEFVYSHYWLKGDLMLWDNRCTLHARSDFDSSQRRLLRRIAVQGEKPF